MLRPERSMWQRVEVWGSCWDKSAGMAIAEGTGRPFVKRPSAVSNDSMSVCDLVKTFLQGPQMMRLKHTALWCRVCGKDSLPLVQSSMRVVLFI